MKKICFPEITVKKEKKVIKYEITPVAVITYTLLTVQGENNICKKIGSFYSKFFTSFDQWVTKDFHKYAYDTFEKDNTPRKKFRYPPLELNYNMDWKNENTQLLEVNISISLTQKKKIISEKKITHIWSLKNGTLHINREKKRRHKKTTTG